MPRRRMDRIKNLPAFSIVNRSALLFLLPTTHTLQPYFPMQKVEKMRLRMSSAVVAPVMASMGRRAA